MKRIILIITLLITLTTIYNFNRDLVNTNLERWINYSFCENPIGYKIGNIDEEFNLSAEDLKLITKNSADIWNESYNKPLFIEDEAAKLTINLTYDGRHKVVNEINILENEVIEDRKILDALTIEYDEKKVKLELDITKLNEEIDYWNKQGGAPEEKYNELIQKTENLNLQTEFLNMLAQKINKNVEAVNNEIHNLNQGVEKFNSLLKIQPEMGTYTSGKEEIHIYFYDSKEELTSVIAHELGHALGLDHLEDDNSLMNPVTTNILKLSDKDLAELGKLCAEKNRFELFQNDIKNFTKTVITRLWGL